MAYDWHQVRAVRFERIEYGVLYGVLGLGLGLSVSPGSGGARDLLDLLISAKTCGLHTTLFSTLIKRTTITAFSIHCNNQLKWLAERCVETALSPLTEGIPISA